MAPALKKALKGYVFTVKDADPADLLRKRVFGVRQRGRGRWTWQMLETFADYATMDPGDLIFFFKKRRLYGVGRITDEARRDATGAWWNWKGASDAGSSAPSTAVYTTPAGTPPVIVSFEPFPVFFKQGIDMDEVLSHSMARPDWGLRFFWKRSFVQLDEQETQTIVGTFVRRFQADLDQARGQAGKPDLRWPMRFTDVVRANPKHHILADGTVRPEAVLHGLLIDALKGQPSLLTGSETPTVRNKAILHEVPASPPKPPEYADRIDLVRIRTFGEKAANLPHHWDVIEAKAGPVAARKNPADVLGQLLKYCDYIAREKCAGDYGAVAGHFVARNFDDRFLDKVVQAAASGRMNRAYVLDPHEKDALRGWSDITLWSYRWNPAAEELLLSESFSPKTGSTAAKKVDSRASRV